MHRTVPKVQGRTAAQGLEVDLETLKALEGLALGVRRQSADTKWREFASRLGENLHGYRTGRPDRGAGDSSMPASSRPTDARSPGGVYHNTNVVGTLSSAT